MTRVEARGAATGWRDAEPMVTRFKAESGRACTRHACQACPVERAANQGSRKARRASAAVLAGLRLAADSENRDVEILGAAGPAELHILRNYRNGRENTAGEALMLGPTGASPQLTAGTNRGDHKLFRVPRASGRPMTLENNGKMFSQRRIRVETLEHA